MSSLFSLTTLKILSLTFDNLIIMCLGVILFNSTYLGPLGLMDLDVHFSPKVRKFSAIIALNILSVPLSFSCLSGIPIMRILFIFMVSHNSCRLPSIFHFFPLFVPLTVYNVLSSRLLIILFCFLF